MSNLTVHSVSTIDLQFLKAKANRFKKTEGATHSVALERAAHDISLPSWRAASELLRLPFYTNEFHRLRIEDTVIILWCSNNDPVQYTDILIDGYTMPNKHVSKEAMEDSFRGQVVWGDVTKLISISGDNEWWFCKYDHGQRMFNLPSINQQQANRIGELLGVVCFTPGNRNLHPLEIQYELNRRDPRPALQESAAFVSLKKWSRKHPKFVKGRSSEYFLYWGTIALGEGRLASPVTTRYHTP